jgi:hypothetical protein
MSETRAADPGTPVTIPNTSLTEGQPTTGNGVPPATDNAPDWRSFLDGLNKLEEVNREVSNKLNKLDTLNATVQRASEAPPEPPPPPNFDEMTNAEIVAHVTGSVTQQMQEAIAAALKPLTDQLAGLHQAVMTNSVTGDMKELRAQHKDFSDWKQEMIGLAQQHPSLGLRDVYLLARANNPEKASKLDAQYAPPAPPRPKPFGGLTPYMMGDKGVKPPLTGEAAAREAYRETAEKYPGILPALQEL